VRCILQLLRFFGAPDVSRIDSAAFLGLRNRQERLPWGPLEVPIGTGQDARLTTYTYDADGWLSSITDALGRVFGFEHDPAGRLLRETFADLRQLSMTYDASGNLGSLTPPGRPAHGFDYTPIDLESAYHPPAAGLPSPDTQYSYNLDRQLDLVTRPDAQTVDYVYDSAGRLSQQVLPGSRTITYTYDPTTKNLVSLAGPDGESLSFTYDGSLLLSETWSGTINGTVSRTYDNDFRITSRSVNGANTANFAYDPDSLLTTAGATALTRDSANGLLTATSLGVVTDSYTYNGFGEVATYEADVSGTPIYSVTYTRDNLGRIAQKVETIQGVTSTYEYGYDTAGRLIDVATNGTATAHYDYDANGNRTGGFNLTGVIADVQYDDQDRLLHSTLGPSTFDYSYTANGELLTKTDATGTTTYNYDALGNLLSVTLPSGDLIEYAVDGRGRRVGKKVNGVLTQGFLYDGQLQVVAELDGSGAVVSRFVYGDRVNVPEYLVRSPDAQHPSPVTYRILTDQLGSPRLVVNVADGSIVQRMDFDEFGNVLAASNPGFQPFGFAGGLYDHDTRLVRFGARDYDAAVGRWTAKDPIGFGGGDANLYGYAVNDPVNLTDAAGLFGLIADPPYPVPPPPPHHVPYPTPLPDPLPFRLPSAPGCAEQQPPQCSPTAFASCMARRGAQNRGNIKYCAAVCSAAAATRGRSASLDAACAICIGGGAAYTYQCLAESGCM